MKDQIAQVQEFHETFRCFLQTTPQARIPEKEIAVRIALMQEELDEYRQAATEGNIVAIADALSDLLYVVFGTLVAHGLQDAAEELFAEVHRSNMSKLDANGQPIYRADGKVLKSERFSEPVLLPIIEKFAGPITPPTD